MRFSPPDLPDGPVPEAAPSLPSTALTTASAVLAGASTRDGPPGRSAIGAGRDNVLPVSVSTNSATPPSCPTPGGTVAVLTAAGSGTRLGAGGPKALVKVGGQSLLRRAAIGLIGSGAVDCVVVTAPPDDVEAFRADIAGLEGGVRVEVVAGSPASRQASVALGLQAALAALPGADVVLVHDAARALTPPQLVLRVVEAVRAGHAAVVPALPVTDTIKEVAPAPEGGRRVEPVVGTAARERLRAVQTPQGFATPVLLEAHRLGAGRAGQEAAAAPDDACLVEAAGGSVVIVPGDELALKVTTPKDLALAEALLDRIY